MVFAEAAAPPSPINIVLPSPDIPLTSKVYLSGLFHRIQSALRDGGNGRAHPHGSGVPSNCHGCQIMGLRRRPNRIEEVLSTGVELLNGNEVPDATSRGSDV